LVAKNKRRSLSKRARFEIFKRDDFTCQYCGGTPPRVTLHVDHITALAEGGDNGDDNLITACADCNLGKGAISLGSVPQSLREKSELVAEREEQLRGYQAILEARRVRLLEEVKRVVEVYEAANPKFTLTDSARHSVQRFVDQLGVHAVVEAMEAACNRGVHDEFRYFCAICWRKIRSDA
jgi:hypothetical protein